MRYTHPPFSLTVRRWFGAIRDSLPGSLIVVVAVLGTIDLVIRVSPWVAELGGVLTSLWGGLPPWGRTLAGLFIVVVVVGWLVPWLYGLWEATVITLAFGRSDLGVRVRRLAHQDRELSIEALEEDKSITRPFAVLLALLYRVTDLRDLLRRLRNLSVVESEKMYERTLDNIKSGWKDGLQGSVLLDYVYTLGCLPKQETGLRLRGQVLVANITYLLGDLLEGRRLADRTMQEAERTDVRGLPIYQWLASYAHANSRLFLGSFDQVASLLGQRWQEKYIALSDEDRRTLKTQLESLSTLDPIASVSRHILLASAFAGKALRFRETELDPRSPAADSTAWAKAWYKCGLDLGKGEPITQDFTHAYMALYCLTVEEVEDPEAVLRRIDGDVPMVSQYVRHGMTGLRHILAGETKWGDALRNLRQADACSRQSGNRFLEGVFLPAHAALAARIDASHLPEARKLLRRATSRAHLARSAFYDSQIDAALSVLAVVAGNAGKGNRLWARARTVDHGMLCFYEPLRRTKNEKFST